MGSASRRSATTAGSRAARACSASARLMAPPISRARRSSRKRRHSAVEILLSGATDSAHQPANCLRTFRRVNSEAGDCSSRRRSPFRPVCKLRKKRSRSAWWSDRVSSSRPPARWVGSSCPTIPRSAGRLRVDRPCDRTVGRGKSTYCAARGAGRETLTASWKPVSPDANGRASPRSFCQVAGKFVSTLEVCVRPTPPTNRTRTTDTAAAPRIRVNAAAAITRHGMCLDPLNHRVSRHQSRAVFGEPMLLVPCDPGTVRHH